MTLKFLAQSATCISSLSMVDPGRSVWFHRLLKWTLQELSTIGWQTGGRTVTEDSSYPRTVSGEGRLRGEYRDVLKCGKVIDDSSEACFSSRVFQIGTFALRSFLLHVNSMCGIHISLVMISLFVVLDGRATWKFWKYLENSGLDRQCRRAWVSELTCLGLHLDLRECLSLFLSPFRPPFLHP